MSGSQDEIPPPPPPPPSSSQTPTQQTPQTVSTIKLPILKKGEYDIWAMKMEHYLAHTDYPIWEVIQNGNGPAIEGSKEIDSISLDELIGTEMFMKIQEINSKDEEDCKTHEMERILTRIRDDKNGKSKRKCFRCGDSNHLIEECPKSSRNNNQRDFIGEALSDSGEDEEEKNKDETYLVAQAANEICLGINLEPDE
ncbi:alpha/beta hydrolases superfamily protein [Tanacetum coccineum]